MSLLLAFLDFVIHIDKYLNLVIQKYGIYTYLILFLIVFSETGLVITPFLPGDSLLFVAGIIASQGFLNIWILFFILLFAAFLGDTVNYWVGHYGGLKIFKKLINEKYLENTEAFYERHGGKTIILARFMPIFRTFAPFVAGIARLAYSRFLIYNFIGGFIWISIFLLGGYFFGNIPFVQENLNIILLIIIFISFLPGIIEYIRHKKAR